MSDRESRTVLVVGAGGGVGLAVVRALLARDFTVLATVYDGSEEVLLRQNSPTVADVQVIDLADASAIAASVAPMLQKHSCSGGLAGVIVCAGISPPGPLEITSLELLRRTFEINVVAALAVYQACMPSLRAARGKLVFISSSAGKAAFPFLGIYVSTKHALEGLCDVMRQEAAHSGVDVLIFEPGGIRTPMVTGTITQIQHQWMTLSQDMKDLYKRQFGRFLGVARAGLAAGMEPGVVAAAIVDALESREPQARYILGEDAIELLNARRHASDREMDAMFEALYAHSEESM